MPACRLLKGSRRTPESHSAQAGAANLNLLANAGREPGQAFLRRTTRLVDVAQRTTDHLFGMDYAAHAIVHDSSHKGLADLLQQRTSELSSALTQISVAIRERNPNVKLQDMEAALERFEK